MCSPPLVAPLAICLEIRKPKSRNTDAQIFSSHIPINLNYIISQKPGQKKGFIADTLRGCPETTLTHFNAFRVRSIDRFVNDH